MVITRTGTPLFFKDLKHQENEDTTVLVAGFLTAIQEFMKETASERVTSVELQNSEYLFESGRNVFVALKIKDQNYLSYLREIGKEICASFERIYDLSDDYNLVSTKDFEGFEKTLIRILDDYGYGIINQLRNHPKTWGMAIFDKSYRQIFIGMNSFAKASQRDLDNASALLRDFLIEAAKAIWAPISRQIDILRSWLVITTHDQNFFFFWTRKIIGIIVSKDKELLNFPKNLPDGSIPDHRPDEVNRILQMVTEVFDRALKVINWGNVQLSLFEFKNVAYMIHYPLPNSITWKSKKFSRLEDKIFSVSQASVVSPASKGAPQIASEEKPPKKKPSLSKDSDLVPET